MNIVEITNEDELEENQDDDEGKKEQEQQKQQAAAAEQEQTKAQLAQIQQTLIQMRSNAEAGKPATKEEVSELEKAYALLVGEGYKVEGLKGQAVLFQAFKEDLLKEVRGEYEKAESEKGQKSLNERCYDRASDELEKIIRGKEISAELSEQLKDPDYRSMILQKMWRTMTEEPGLQSARNAYQKGVAPMANEFEKAARLVLQKLPGGLTTMSRDKSEQLDSKSSKPGSGHPAVSKKGEVDTSKLNDWEREVYMTALNTTKNKDIALHALQTIKQKP